MYLKSDHLSRTPGCFLYGPRLWVKLQHPGNPA